MLAYSRALAASGEVGRLDILYDFNDPSGIATCNAVDGGVVYITGAAVLHYLPGAAHVPASSPSAQAPAPGETLRPIDTVPSTKSDGLQPESMP